jgi:hypothetical protein
MDDESSMIIEHVYTLNRALDGKDIYSMPSFADFEMTEIAIALYKNDLIENGILESYTTFTAKGVQLTKCLYDFKKAIKYVKILDIVLGIVDETKAVMLQIHDNRYIFTLIDTKDAAQQLRDAFTFLAFDSKEDKINDKSTHITLNKLVGTYELNSRNSFSLITEQKSTITTEIYFCDKNKIHVYDCENNILHQKNSHSVKQLLTERLAV